MNLTFRNFPTTDEGFQDLLAYLEKKPSVEGYLYLFNRFDLDDLRRGIVAEQIEDASLLTDVEEDLFEADEDEFELYLWVNFPPTPSGAHEMCDFIRDHQSDFAWDFFEDHHIQFLTAYEKQQMFAFKSKIFDFNMHEEEFKASMLNMITSLYLEDVDSQAIHPIPITFVINHIANSFDVSSDEIMSKKRSSLFARYACIYILFELREFTTKEVAEAFDISVNRVQKIFKQVQAFYNINSDFKDRIDALMEELDQFFDVV